MARLSAESVRKKLYEYYIKRDQTSGKIIPLYTRWSCQLSDSIKAIQLGKAPASYMTSGISDSQPERNALHLLALGKPKA